MPEKKEDSKKVTYSVTVQSDTPGARRNPTDGFEIIRVQVPSSYKVTFGPIVPGTKGGANELAFRVYDGSKCRLLLRRAAGFWSDDVTILDEKGESVDPATVLGVPGANARAVHRNGAAEGEEENPF